MLPSDMVRGVLLPMLSWRTLCAQMRLLNSEWKEAVQFKVLEEQQHRRERSAQLRMFAEDSKRLEAHTAAHLLAWCEQWTRSVVCNNPWWLRPPSKCRGALVDAQDFQKSWCPAEILGWRDETRIYPPLAPLSVVHRDNARAAPGPVRQETRTTYHVRFLGWSGKWDEWVPASRIKAFGSRTTNPVRNSVAATQQWMLRRVRGRWDLRMTRSHAVTSVNATSIFPATDVLTGLLVADRGPLHGVRI